MKERVALFSIHDSGVLQFVADLFADCQLSVANSASSPEQFCEFLTRVNPDAVVVDLGFHFDLKKQKTLVSEEHQLRLFFEEEPACRNMVKRLHLWKHVNLLTKSKLVMIASHETFSSHGMCYLQAVFNGRLDWVITPTTQMTIAKIRLLHSL